MSKPEALLVFGDSLSDQGNAFDLSGRVLKVPIPPASAGYNGWFSNGLIQSGVTADLLGVEAGELRGRRRPGGRVAHGGAVPRGERLRHAGDHAARTRTRWRSPPTPTSAGRSGGISSTRRRTRRKTARRRRSGSAPTTTTRCRWTPRRSWCWRRSRRWSATPSWRRGRSRRPGSSGSSSTTCRRRSSCRCRCRRSSPRWSTGTTRHSPQGWRSWRARGSTPRSSTCTASGRRSSPTRAPSG